MNKFCQIKLVPNSAYFDNDVPLLKDESIILSCEWKNRPKLVFRGREENLGEYLTEVGNRHNTHKTLEEVEWEKNEDGWSAKEPFEFWFLFEGRLINFSHAHRSDNYDGYILSMTSICRPVQSAIYGWVKEKVENE